MAGVGNGPYLSNGPVTVSPNCHFNVCQGRTKIRPFRAPQFFLWFDNFLRKDYMKNPTIFSNIPALVCE